MISYLFFYRAPLLIQILFNIVRRVWRYKRVNHNREFEEGQTTRWPKEKLQMTNNDLQSITQKTKGRAKRKLPICTK